MRLLLKSSAEVGDVLQINKMNILLLGSNGFIGSHLTNLLFKEGHNTIGFGRGAPSQNVSYTHYIQSDFIPCVDFLDILNDFEIDIVYQLVSTSIPSSDTDRIQQGIIDNVFPTLRLLEAMRNSKRSKSLIFGSSGGAIYGNLDSPNKMHESLPTKPICAYGIQKLTIENYLRLYASNYNLRCISARIANPYGLGGAKREMQGIIPILLKKNFLDEPITLFGNTVRDYIHISDVVDCLSRLISKDFESDVLNVGSGVGTSLSCLIKIIEKVSGQPFKRKIILPKRNFDIQNNVLDITLAEKSLHWQPKIQLEEGIRALWREMLTSGALKKFA